MGGDPLEIALARCPRLSKRAAHHWVYGSKRGLDQLSASILFPHQAEAVRRLLHVLHQWGGALLADATGLGKSYVALALARTLGAQTCLIVPATLRTQWRSLARRFEMEVEIVSHEQLSRRRMPGQDAQLVIVDEAHHFTNTTTNRYEALARWVLHRKLMLITATPIVNRSRDFVALLRLFLPDHALCLLGIPSLDTLSVSERSRRSVMDELAVARGHLELKNPACRLPARRTLPPQSAAAVSIEQVAPALEAIEGLAVSSGDHPRALMRLHFYRQLSSSRAAFHQSMKRHARFLERTSEARREGLKIHPKEYRTLLRTASGDEDQFLLLPMLLQCEHVSPTDLTTLERDRSWCLRAIEVTCGTADPKLEALDRVLRQFRGKALVFVNTIATARYLLRSLRERGAVAVTGAGAWTAAGRLPFDEALRPFRPNARVPHHLDAEILIATDIAGEGLNLQGAQFVVHYDLPWSPVRLGQRSGRVRRLGSPHAAIHEMAFAPSAPIGERIQVVQRLLAKATLAQSVGPPGESLAAAIAPGHAGRAAEPAPAVGVLYRLHLNGYRVTRGLDRGLSQATVLSQIRAAMRIASTPPSGSDPVVRRARRILLQAARYAARERSVGHLQSIDGALTRLSHGLTAGERLRLADALLEKGKLAAISRWIAQLAPRPVEFLRVELRVVDADRTP